MFYAYPSYTLWPLCQTLEPLVASHTKRFATTELVPILATVHRFLIKNKAFQDGATAGELQTEAANQRLITFLLLYTSAPLGETL